MDNGTGLAGYSHRDCCHIGNIDIRRQVYYRCYRRMSVNMLSYITASGCRYITSYIGHGHAADLQSGGIVINIAFRHGISGSIGSASISGGPSESLAIIGTGHSSQRFSRSKG